MGFLTFTIVPMKNASQRTAPKRGNTLQIMIASPVGCDTPYTCNISHCDPLSVPLIGKSVDRVSLADDPLMLCILSTETPRIRLTFP